MFADATLTAMQDVDVSFWPDLLSSTGWEAPMATPLLFMDY